jgi:hypothetical protein
MDNRRGGRHNVFAVVGSRKKTVFVFMQSVSKENSCQNFFQGKVSLYEVHRTLLKADRWRKIAKKKASSSQQ